MVKTTQNGSLLPPFLVKCYEMVSDQSTDALISWSSTNNSFVIWDESKFSSELLPKYFKHNNFSSFIRQLNIYGFRKIDTDRWEFANDGFIKGQKHLLKNISRRKQTQGLVQRKSSQQKEKDVGACEENKNIGLWKEVENLKTDKNALMQELNKLRQHQQASQSKLLLLREQLQGMEKNQQQMLSFIVMSMQNPGFLVQLLQPKENNWHMAEAGKNSLKRVTDDHEPVPSEGMIVRYQAPMDESPEYVCTPTSDSENTLELDLSSDEVKDLFMNIDFMSVPLEEKFLSSESHGPIILQDLPDDDGMLEHLLWSSSFLENNEESELDAEEHTISGMEEESMPCGTQPKESDKSKFLTEGLKKSQNLMMETSAVKTQLDNSQNMEILTEQMGLLASENNLKH
uniref:Heat stress transcription factor n=1 Tax=Davidia involucrata TaxID=16924 RepID=A0A5B7A7E5_DAVIN